MSEQNDRLDEELTSAMQELGRLKDQQASGDVLFRSRLSAALENARIGEADLPVVRPSYKKIIYATMAATLPFFFVLSFFYIRLQKQDVPSDLPSTPSTEPVADRQPVAQEAKPSSPAQEAQSYSRALQGEVSGDHVKLSQQEKIRTLESLAELYRKKGDEAGLKRVEAQLESLKNSQ